MLGFTNQVGVCLYLIPFLKSLIAEKNNEHQHEQIILKNRKRAFTSTVKKTKYFTSESLEVALFWKFK